jgi:hypothetical protein
VNFPKYPFNLKGIPALSIHKQFHLNQWILTWTYSKGALAVVRKFNPGPASPSHMMDAGTVTLAFEDQLPVTKYKSKRPFPVDKTCFKVAKLSLLN